jgi:hypothetical protein
MEAAASDGRLDIVKWLHETYPECCTDVDVAISNAAEHGHLDVVKWLSSNLPCTNPRKALIAAAGFSCVSPTRRQLDVVQYLLPKCGATDIAPAMGRAMKGMHFEVVLLVHTQHPTVTGDELQSVKDEQRYSAKPFKSNREMSEWIEENYSLDSESE